MTVKVSMAGRAPRGDYTLVSSGQELQQLLKAEAPAVKYLQLSSESQFFAVPEDGLNPAAFTSSVILCNGHTIDMLEMKPYAVEPQSEINLYSCTIFGPSHDSPWAAKTVLNDCVVVRQCEVCSDLVAMPAPFACACGTSSAAQVPSGVHLLPEARLSAF